MKKVFLFAAMLAMVASCSISEIDSIKGIEEGTEEKKEKAPEITASYENNNTKTTITTNDEGVGTIWWKPADEINVFYGTTSTHYVSKNTENATTVAFGTTDVIGSTESASQNIWGLYPYDENAVCDGESVTTTIPAAQQAIAGSFDDDIFTSLAHSTSTVMTFYNVLGGIKFSLSRDDIKKITFKGNNDEYIAGKAKLEMDANGKPVAVVDFLEGESIITLTPKEGTTFAKNTNYYIVMLPTVLSKGFTMTFETETEVGIFEYTTKSIEIKRSVFSKKENIDSYAEFKIPLTISSIGSTSVAFMRKNLPLGIYLEYRKGYGNWSEYTINTSIDLEDGEFVQFRADEYGNKSFMNQPSSAKYHFFKSTGSGNISVSGNIMSLLYQNMEGVFPHNDVCFAYLFSECENLIDASKLELPATTLKENCYSEMFYNCKSLQTAPDLPAIHLAEGCYKGMFYNCRSLQTAPELPAALLYNNCYSEMFYQCASLQTAPELPATDLYNNCYSEMFVNCINLQTAPELPATTLKDNCYSGMFSGCTSLETAPDLPATNLASDCYTDMFYGCSNLKYVKALFETTPSDSYTLYWLYGVSSTGTFVKSKNATWDVTGPNGIPEGWSVLTE